MKIFSFWRFVNKDPENLGAFREINSCILHVWNRQPSCIMHQVSSGRWQPSVGYTENLHETLCRVDISSRQIQELFCPEETWILKKYNPGRDTDKEQPAKQISLGEISSNFLNKYDHIKGLPTSCFGAVPRSNWSKNHHQCNLFYKHL